MATIALFVALGGTSYAVTALPKNSVGTPQLKKSAVTGEKVKDGSLSGADFIAGTLLKGDTGATGPQGPVGATGATGETGAMGPAGGTYGVSAGDSQTSPILTNSVRADYQTMYIAQAGKQMVFGRADLTFAGNICAGVTSPVVFLAIDDVVVANSARTLPDTATAYDGITLFGHMNVSQTVGNHEFQLRVGCTGGASAPTATPSRYNVAFANITAA